MFIFTVVIIGLSGIIAQVLLLRELLVSFLGNELTVGIILANWILGEAFGVFIAGKLIERVKFKKTVFFAFIFLFCAFFPLCVYWARSFRGFLGIPFGQALGLETIFLASFLINLPLSFTHGALFSISCKLKKSIGNVYAWETLGTIAGGLIFTYLLIPFVGFSQWKAPGILESRNSVYGNIAVARQAEQYTFFYNGVPVTTTPYPDITFTQEFGKLPLLSHSGPKSVLVVSAGVGGLLNEILSSPITKVDYVELDPLLIKLVKQYPTPLTERELADKRVKIINTDGRLFVRSAAEKYDVILVGLSKPQDLSVNRFFSREFFELTKKRLNPSGVFAICLPGSLSYLSQELKDVNASVINGLKQAYGYVRIIPGDYNMLIASESGTVMEVVPSLITQRLKERKIEPGILVPGYLDYRLSERWVDWFSQASVGATKEVNRDLRPIAVLEMMALWTKQFSPMTSFILGQAKKLNFVLPAIVILACSVMVGMFKNKRLVLAYGIAATGFFGMFANVALILAYQVRYGYLYYQIGVLVSLFMAGAAIGSLLMMRLMQKQDNHKLILWLEAGMIIFTLSLPALILSKIFMILFLIPGFFVGAQFPLAAKMYGKGEGEASGVLYGADLMGGWLAGMVGGIILLPVFGLWKMCLVMVMLKLSSLVLLLVERRG